MQQKWDSLRVEKDLVLVVAAAVAFGSIYFSTDPLLRQGLISRVGLPGGALLDLTIVGVLIALVTVGICSAILFSPKPWLKWVGFAFCGIGFLQDIVHLAQVWSQVAGPQGWAIAMANVACGLWLTTILWRDLQKAKLPKSAVVVS